MQDEDTEAKVKETLVAKSNDHKEAYVGQLQLQTPPLALYHFSRQFACECLAGHSICTLSLRSFEASPS